MRAFFFFIFAYWQSVCEQRKQQLQIIYYYYLYSLFNRSNNGRANESHVWQLNICPSSVFYTIKSMICYFWQLKMLELGVCRAYIQTTIYLLRMHSIPCNRILRKIFQSTHRQFAASRIIIIIFRYEFGWTKCIDLLAPYTHLFAILETAVANRRLRSRHPMANKTNKRMRRPLFRPEIRNWMRAPRKIHAFCRRFPLIKSHRSRSWLFGGADFSEFACVRRPTVCAWAKNKKNKK